MSSWELNLLFAVRDLMFPPVSLYNVETRGLSSCPPRLHRHPLRCRRFAPRWALCTATCFEGTHPNELGLRRILRYPFRTKCFLNFFFILKKNHYYGAHGEVMLKSDRAIWSTYQNLKEVHFAVTALWRQGGMDSSPRVGVWVEAVQSCVWVRIRARTAVLTNEEWCKQTLL